MKLPVWLTVQLERQLDKCKPLKLTINTNGTGEFKVTVEETFTAPKEQPAGMTEY